LQTPGPMPTDFVPLMGMLTGIVSMLVIGFTIVRVAQSQIGQAIARRIHGKGATDPELREELHELREQVAELQHRLGESEERLDFTERLLARGRDEAASHG
jgi:uncharacterized protein YlxW (UPF0749 family)